MALNLPDHVNLGDPGHVQDTNLIIDAIAQLEQIVIQGGGGGGGGSVGSVDVYAQTEPPGLGSTDLLWVDIDDQTSGGGAVGGGSTDVYAQAAAPADAPTDVLWVDIDDTTGGGGGGGTGVTDHGDLTGLADPDHPISAVQGLQAALDGKAATDHTHSGSGGQFVTPEMYGAKGDGSTDDTAAIQAAINSNQAVFFAPKTYRITSALTVSSSYGGTHLIGVRSTGTPTSEIVQTSTTAHCLTGVDVLELIVSDIRLIGPGSGSGDGINLTRSGLAATHYVQLDGVYVKSFGRDGISVSNLITSSFNQVTCESNKRYGFHLYGTSGGAAGTSVALNGCYANGNSNAGYRIDTMAYCGFNGCASENQPIDFDVVDCQGVSFTGCGSEANKGISWRISGTRCYGVGLYSCWTYLNGGRSVWVTGGAKNAMIVSLVENSPSGIAIYCRQVDPGSTATVIGGSRVMPDLYGAYTTTILDDGGGLITTNDIAIRGTATLAADPTQPLQASTKQYTDAKMNANVVQVANFADVTVPPPAGTLVILTP